MGSLLLTRKAEAAASHASKPGVGSMNQHDDNAAASHDSRLSSTPSEGADVAAAHLSSYPMWEPRRVRVRSRLFVPIGSFGLEFAHEYMCNSNGGSPSFILPKQHLYTDRLCMAQAHQGEVDGTSSCCISGGVSRKR